MILSCPKCEGRQLTVIARGVSKCSACGGSLVAPGASADVLAEPAAKDVAQNDAQGARCPADHSIMTRTEVFLGDDRTVHLERCSSCRNVWFDAGEWNALAERHLVDNLDELWSLEWRNQQRRAREHDQHMERIREEFGAELYGELEAVAKKLRGHDRRSQALAFLREMSS